MRINPDMSSNIIGVTKKDSEKKPGKLHGSPGERHDKVYDKVKVENKYAANVHVDGVDEAKDILSNIVNELPSSNKDLHNLDVHRLIGLFQ